MNEERNIDAVRALIPSTLWWSAQAGALTGMLPHWVMLSGEEIGNSTLENLK